MASEIRVTSGTITTKKENLRTLNASFKSMLSGMDSTEKQLMGMWDGDASQAFHKNYQQDAGIRVGFTPFSVIPIATRSRA